MSCGRCRQVREPRTMPASSPVPIRSDAGGSASPATLLWLETPLLLHSTSVVHVASVSECEFSVLRRELASANARTGRCSHVSCSRLSHVVLALRWEDGCFESRVDHQEPLLRSNESLERLPSPTSSERA